MMQRNEHPVVAEHPGKAKTTAKKRRPHGLGAGTGIFSMLFQIHDPVFVFGPDWLIYRKLVIDRLVIAGIIIKTDIGMKTQSFGQRGQIKANAVIKGKLAFNPVLNSTGVDIAKWGIDIIVIADRKSTRLKSSH